MHFGIPTAFGPSAPEKWAKITWHDCFTITSDNTDPFYPCLNPKIFNPSELDVQQWVDAALAMGVSEIAVTAQHEGGFALWDSAYTNYSSAHSTYGVDILDMFVPTLKKAGIGVAYYINIQSNGYFADTLKLSGEEFSRRELGMLREILTKYTPERLWFDGTKHYPRDMNLTEHWEKAMVMIRTLSPNTLVSAYRGDICYSPHTSVYTSSAPFAPNTTATNMCSNLGDPHGTHFFPLESHGLTMQEGPNGMTDVAPTYWFYHPSVGFGNASRLFNGWVNTAGRGHVLTLNIAPNHTGLLDPGIVQVMHDFGTAVNETFRKPLATAGPFSGPCASTTFVLDLSSDSFTVADIDYVQVMEDMSQGQRVSNYSIQFKPAGATEFQTYVPPATCNPNTDGKCVNAPNCATVSDFEPSSDTSPSLDKLGDTPCGHYARDSYIGSRRIDCPKAPGGVPLNPSTKVDAVRFQCISSLEDPINIKSISVHKHTAPFDTKPWEV